MKPLYIWAGGKNKMIPKYQNSPGIPYNGYDTYVEPFFGGGAMMIHIHENNPSVKRFVMNDINPEIVGIYTAIKTDVNNFKDRMDTLEAQWLPLDKDGRKKFFYALRDEYTQRWTQWNATDESATLYFLMKTAFNGIWQTTKTSNGRFATPVGLCNQTTKVYDKWNVDEWHIFLQKVDIYCGDWNSCVAQIENERAFFFMDPPYIDSFTSYGQVFNNSEQLKLLNFCHKADANGDIVFFCNRDDGSNIWTSNQGNLGLEYYDIKYTAGRRATEENGNRTAKKATEILLYSKSIVKPQFNPELFEVLEN
jgi:DNA adenine methylase